MAPFKSLALLAVPWKSVVVCAAVMGVHCRYHTTPQPRSRLQHEQIHLFDIGSSGRLAHARLGMGRSVAKAQQEIEDSITTVVTAPELEVKGVFDDESDDREMAVVTA